MTTERQFRQKASGPVPRQNVKRLPDSVTTELNLTITLQYIVLFFFKSAFLMFFFTWENSAIFLPWQPRGASDQKKTCRNENFRQFAIGDVYHFFVWDGLSEKLWQFKHLKAVDLRTFRKFQLFYCDITKYSQFFIHVVKVILKCVS